jgi:phosphatidylethanolamine/phosphatidyl-N-methylethanolamine N-methyltransferase
MKIFTKKEIKRNFWGKAYDEYLYKGLTGIFLNYNHKIINNYSKKKTFKIVMEFGGAGKPHWNWMDKNKLKNIDKYILVDDKFYLSKIKIPKFLSPKKVIKIDYRQFDRINKYRNKVDRIIASHVLEHIPDPESALINWMNLLSKRGSMCIALPCDPGWLYRLGQILSMNKACRLYKIKPLEKDLWQSREHINALQRLIYIFNYYFKKRKTLWFPFLLPITNINLFHFMEVNKNDFRQ